MILLDSEIPAASHQRTSEYRQSVRPHFAPVLALICGHFRSACLRLPIGFVLEKAGHVALHLAESGRAVPHSSSGEL